MTDSAKPLILGLGELLWDLLPDGKQLGGAPANFAYHAQALGAEARVISAVGVDALGAKALERLRDADLNTECIVTDRAHPTGTVEVTLNENGQPGYTIVENVAWDFIPQSRTASELAARADAICFGTLAQRSATSRGTIRFLLQQASRKCLRILDVNLRAPFIDAAVVRESCALADVLKFNDEELPWLAQMLGRNADEDALFAELFARYRFRLIALTRGSHGATLVTQGEQIDFPAEPPTTLADTVGAGDAFTASMTLGWLRKLPLREIGVIANRVASHVCSQKGAMPDMQRFRGTFT